MHVQDRMRVHGYDRRVLVYVRVILEQGANQDVHSHCRQVLINVQGNTRAGGKFVCT